jgi:hypothetical protein
MKIKVSELIGQPLNWAVASIEFPKGAYGGEAEHYSGNRNARWIRIPDKKNRGYTLANYSTNWEQGGPIIDANPTMQFWVWGGRPDYRPGELQCASMAAIVHGGTQHKTWFGKTKLIAAMRCYVASKLGDEIDIPKELL